jgi:hypothetical protein
MRWVNLPHNVETYCISVQGSPVVKEYVATKGKHPLFPAFSHFVLLCEARFDVNRPIRKANKPFTDLGEPESIFSRSHDGGFCYLDGISHRIAKTLSGVERFRRLGSRSRKTEKCYTNDEDASNLAPATSRRWCFSFSGTYGIFTLAITAFCHKAFNHGDKDSAPNLGL